MTAATTEWILNHDRSTSGNVATLFAERAESMRGAIASIDRHRGDDRTTTFAELEERGARLTALLRASGLGRGDVVLLGHPPGLELYTTILAILRIGGVALIVEPGAGRGGIVAACEMARPRAVFAPGRVLALALTIPAVRRISHLPVIVDPSHGTGKNFMVTPLARAGVAVGADGLIVEVHDQPEQALSDGAQALTLDQYDQLVSEVRSIHEVISPAAVG